MSPHPVAGRRALKRFLAYVRPFYGLISLSALCGLGKFILPSTMALSAKYLTDRLVPNPNNKATAQNDVIAGAIDRYVHWLSVHLPASWELNSTWGQFQLLMMTLIVIYVLWAVTFYYRSYFSQLAGHRVILNLRTDLYQHITRMGHGFFQMRQSGGIVSRLMADIALAQNFVGNAMTAIWMDLGACTFYLYVLFTMDRPLAWASLVVFPFYVLAMRTFGDASKKSSREVQEALEEFSGDVQERVAGINVVKSFAAERREAKTFFIGARSLFNLTMKNVRITTLANTSVQWLTQMATLMLIWYGGYRVMHHQTTLGTIFAFVLLLRELYFPINRISEMNTILHNSLAAIDRIFEVFDIQPDVMEPARPVILPRLRGEITFDGMSFSYAAPQADGAGAARMETPVLRDISLRVEAGEVVALVGPSGAGKSTLVQMIPRFYDPQEGRLLIDGRDVREVQLRSLRSQIGIVSQETILFSGTARDNILYGKPGATEEELTAAARAAHAHEFITQLPLGYETLLGERGAKLSGGQKQRIAIARAFLCNPRILILDEATSALDSESELLIQEALAKLMRGRTNVVIAHRLSTILSADRIVVMSDGKVVDTGPHAELLARGGLYARLYHTQFRTALAG